MSSEKAEPATTKADQYKYPYEPTPYSVLERLANSGEILKNNVLLDYGCGKGRVDFFLSYQTRCKSIGIEYDERIYKSATANQENAVSGRRVQLELANAEQYQVPIEVDRCFFFNPFSVEILRKAMARIVESYHDRLVHRTNLLCAKAYENPREMLLFFYYPSDEYVSYLMTVDEIAFYDEIDCRDLFDGDNPRERIMIFEMA